MNDPLKCCKCEESSNLLQIAYENKVSYFCKACARQNKLLPPLPSEWIKERQAEYRKGGIIAISRNDPTIHAILDYLDEQFKNS